MVRQVRICGFGGQGVVLAGVILGEAAVLDGKWAAGASSYGAQARGGYARSDLVISDRPIVYPRVMEADLLVAMAQSAYDRYSEELAQGALVIYEKGLVSPREMEAVRQVGIPATGLAIKELDARQAANMVMLGALVALSGVVSREALLRVIGERSGAFGEVNLKAAQLGFRLGEERWRS